MAGEIKITCKGSDVKPIEQLRDFQGSLKTLKPEQLGKLKRSILKYGFTFPVFTWQDKILDGHQRLFATKELVKEGYEIDDIPVVEIEAENKKEAGEKLLALNSQYAKITEDELAEYINKTGVDISELAGDLDLPEFDLDSFLDGDIEIIKNDDLDTGGAGDHFYGSNSRVLRLGDLMCYITDEQLIEQMQSFTDAIINKDEAQQTLNTIGEKIAWFIIENKKEILKSENIFLSEEQTKHHNLHF